MFIKQARLDINRTISHYRYHRYFDEYSVSFVYGYISNIEEKACMGNRLIIKRSYELYLYNEQLNHTSLLFDKFILENNYKPIRHDAWYVYNNEEVICSHHDEEDVSDDEVPY